MGRKEPSLEKKEEHVASLTKETGRKTVLDIINTTTTNFPKDNVAIASASTLVTPTNLSGRMAVV